MSSEKSFKMKMKHKIKFIAYILIYCIPPIVSADVFISEIMYDQEGTDSKREWVEVYNSGPEISDFTQYKFLENEVHHGLKEFEGGLTLPANSYAIIADNPHEILSDIPEGAIVFDSAFSLSNSGEVIAIVGANKEIIDEVFYDVEIGASGDGNTLQKIDGVWVAQSQTPGRGPEITTEVENKQTDQENIQIQQSSSAKPKPIIQDPFTVEIVEPEKIFVGEIVTFMARASDSHGDALKFNNYKWNTGDGSVYEGNSITHTYKKPGEYIVYASGTYGYESDYDKLRVTVKEVPISFSATNEGINIKNNSIKEFDLSGWIIFADTYSFKIPQNTFLLPKSEVVFSNQVTGLNNLTDTYLMTASGQTINSFAAEEKSVLKSAKQKNVSARSTKNISGPKPANTATIINPVIDKEASSDNTYIWYVLLGFIVILGLTVLYFSSKKTTLIDEIEIID